MGVIAESMMAYAQPLLDQTDGSTDQTRHALQIAQICWNLALLPKEDRETRLAEIGPALEMDAAEFEDFQQSIVAPMIRRHRQMFPNLARFDSRDRPQPSRKEKYPGTGRNAPCPCNSGKKYKRCCGR